MNIFLTGATGFVGRQIKAALLAQTTHCLRVAYRTTTPFQQEDRVSVFRTAGLQRDTHWEAGLSGCEVVIHAAARVHVMKETHADPLSQYREINVEGTLNLAHQAAKVGVKRFIFLSSIKVNGEETFNGQCYGPDDQVDPSDPYALSKLEAERGLIEIGEHTGMEIVIIRPPLVYGPGVKGNFLRMMTCIKSGLPLPLGLINNKRSFVSVYNLVDLICLCVDHPNAVNQIFLVSDGEEVSTSLLLKRIAHAMGKSPRLIPVPSWMIAYAGKLLRQSAAVQRLCGSLQVDISKTQSLLNWQPKQHMQEVLKVI
jgi:nucleoside-diphosphate-sugar epimerase